MANTICHDGYCEPALNRKDSSEMAFGFKAMIIGGYVLFAIALGAFSWYGAGYYPVITSLS